MLPAWGRSVVLPMTQPIDGCPSYAASQRSAFDTEETICAVDAPAELLLRWSGTP